MWCADRSSESKSEQVHQRPGRVAAYDLRSYFPTKCGTEHILFSQSVIFTLAVISASPDFGDLWPRNRNNNHESSYVRLQSIRFLWSLIKPRIFTQRNFDSIRADAPRRGINNFRVH